MQNPGWALARVHAVATSKTMAECDLGHRTEQAKSGLMIIIERLILGQLF